MSLTDLPVIKVPPEAGGRALDLAGLNAALSRAVVGEVRIDRLSRALYATDASVYQIVPAGVVLPRSEADVVATVRACADFRVPLTARGGARRRRASRSGQG